MPATLLLTPTTDTALDHLAAQVNLARANDPLTPIHILLPSRALIEQVRGQIGVTMNVRLHQFYTLGRAILAEKGVRVHQIRDTAARRLVHHILGDLLAQNQLTTFAPVWDKPGFTHLMVTWLREMKSQGIPPEDVAAHAQASGQERDRQLALLYDAYQRFLQDRHASDDDGLLWLAAEALERDGDLYKSDGPCFVYGFDQFNPIQRRILAKLTDRFTDFAVYLQWDAARPPGSLALSRMTATRSQLITDLGLAETVLPAADDFTAPALIQLSHLLFEPTKDPIPGDLSASLALVEAPSREQEVRWTLRAVKRLLIAGIPAPDIAILAPNPQIYARTMQTVAQEYGVPVQVSRTLGDNPAMAALLTLLSLAPAFPRRETFDALRSPYVRQSWLNLEQIDLLDQLTRDRPVIAGRDQWEFALQPVSLAADPDAETDEDRADPLLAGSLDPATLDALRAGLTAFFDHITPPPSASHRTFTLWIQEAVLGLFGEEEEDQIGDGEGGASKPSLDFMAACGQGSFAERDLQALGLTTAALGELVRATDFVQLTGETVPWDAFRSDLLNILPAVTIPPDPALAAVPFGPLEAGRAAAVDHLFVLGLSEGEFPTSPPPDPLYAPAEREDHFLPLRRWQSGDDASLWWQVVANCRRKLTLLRPYVDDSGAPWPASPYWREVAQRVSLPKPTKLPIAETVSPQDAAGEDELLLALAAQGARTVPSELAEPWHMAQAAQALNRQRDGWGPPGPFEGVLQNPHILAELDRRYHAAHVWSASRLNRYANCPYGFFAENILKLEARTDPEEGLDAMKRGSILHAILERLYGRLTVDNRPPNPENRDAILAILDECCQFVFRDAPTRYGFRPTALWGYERDELARLLTILVGWECDEASDFLPFRQEVGFGIKGGDPVLIEDAAGAGFYLRGFIDRIDRSPDGRLRILDYKSGSTGFSGPDLQKGLALQTVLYAKATETILADAGSVERSEYLHIPTRKTSGKLDFTDAKSDLTVEAALLSATSAVQRVRQGIFPSAPGKSAQNGEACSNWCELAGLCRATRQSRWKANRYLESAP